MVFSCIFRRIEIVTHTKTHREIHEKIGYCSDLFSELELAMSWPAGVAREVIWQCPVRVRVRVRVLTSGDARVECLHGAVGSSARL
eukprot:scaffold362723_cov33-Prasinocladus_malaysianus.AAC.1